MKYQRNGKTYDTETARMVLAADNGKAAASPQFFRQTHRRVLPALRGRLGIARGAVHATGAEQASGRRAHPARGCHRRP